MLYLHSCNARCTGFLPALEPPASLHPYSASPFLVQLPIKCQVSFLRSNRTLSTLTKVTLRWLCLARSTSPPAAHLTYFCCLDRKLCARCTVVYSPTFPIPPQPSAPQPSPLRSIPHAQSSALAGPPLAHRAVHSPAPSQMAVMANCLFVCLHPSLGGTDAPFTFCISNVHWTNKLNISEGQPRNQEAKVSPDLATGCHITAATKDSVLGTMCPCIRHKSTGPKCGRQESNFKYPYTFCQGTYSKFCKVF